ncbi:MAG: potassium-transporting ATPase subunit KdpC [Aquabacterium sp.]|jgi:K+-transporting ATPase ATPase C chain|uniref:potassium-transporting ATPase subunit KdpC n=1 Tax=Aquabacterium sp. TaxID=1872578 RepID=UPI002A36C0B0|nr:potassium-transporting ATPase subunit KdpC [Aquabacterium sp.]MDX9844616.1 potassium-transporting ATPase subunit KdpC [Aquabacterium sp.]
MQSQSPSHSYVRPAVSLFVMLSVVTGVAYPLAVTGVGQGLFPAQANGSLVSHDGGQVVGSRLIGQAFTDPGHFWSRPSATAPTPYNAANSAGSNLGPLNPALQDAVKARVEALRAIDPGNTRPVPVDLVTASGSGLDPHISVAAAQFQAARVARVRDLPHLVVQDLIDRHTEQPWLGFFGEPRVHVLALNIDVDAVARARTSSGQN